MSKVERLNARVAKLLSEAVQEVLELVKETVSEYQEKSARTQRENESLKRRLLEIQDRMREESTPALPAYGTLPEEKQDAEVHEQDVSLIKIHNSGLTEHQPTHTADHHVKQEGKEQESHKKKDFSPTSSEYCKVQPEKGMFMTKEATTVLTSHSGNSDASIVSSDTHSPNARDVNLPAVKREPEPTNCSSSELSPLPEQYPGCVDLSCNSSRHRSADTLRPHVRADPYSLVFTHSKHGVPRRHGFARSNRATFDVTKFKRERMRGDDSHSCVFCGKTFSRVGNLRIHQRCHTGEKPYGCIQCGRRFSQAGDLKKHKRVHTGEKPYYCNQCGKSFSRGENLKRHQKIHIGETLQLQQAWREHQL